MKKISRETGCCPLDYGRVYQVHKDEKVYKCSVCGARLEEEHITNGAKSLRRVNRRHMEVTQ